MYKEYGISEKIENIAIEVQKDIEEVFKEINKICEYNSLKVLSAFQKNNVSDMHFNSTTGYGYGDIGRECIENIFKDILKAEDCLVRNQFISGTHALTVALFAFLRPGDTMLSINGKPYDTLDSVIGLEENKSSLKSFGIQYEQIDLINDEFNYSEIEKRVKKGGIKLIEIQRSRGYDNRSSISIERVEKVIKLIKQIDENIIIMVDNCYCEFVGEKEPLEVGADIIVGSLIKNLGGGVANNRCLYSRKKRFSRTCSRKINITRSR